MARMRWISWNEVRTKSNSSLFLIGGEWNLEDQSDVTVGEKPALPHFP
jgi:hypothetical protein